MTPMMLSSVPLESSFCCLKPWIRCSVVINPFPVVVPTGSAATCEPLLMHVVSTAYFPVAFGAEQRGALPPSSLEPCKAAVDPC